MSVRGIQRSRRKGDRLPAGTICVDRSTKWGNPYRVVPDHGGGWMVISPVGEIARHLGTKVEASRIAVEAFAALLDNPVTGIAYPSKAEIRATLRGHDLGCWCPVTMPDQDSPRGLVRYPCHRWPLMEVANA